MRRTPAGARLTSSSSSVPAEQDQDEIEEDEDDEEDELESLPDANSSDLDEDEDLSSGADEGEDVLELARRYYGVGSEAWRATEMEMEESV